MTKKEVISDIMYGLKFKGSADFECDNESFSISSLPNGGYVIQSRTGSITVANRTELRKEISKLGKVYLEL